MNRRNVIENDYNKKQQKQQQQKLCGKIKKKIEKHCF